MEDDCNFWSFNPKRQSGCGLASDVYASQIKMERGAHSGSNYEESCGITGLGLVGTRHLKSSRAKTACGCARQCKDTAQCQVTAAGAASCHLGPASCHLPPPCALRPAPHTHTSSHTLTQAHTSLHTPTYSHAHTLARPHMTHVQISSQDVRSHALR